MAAAHVVAFVFSAVGENISLDTMKRPNEKDMTVIAENYLRTKHVRNSAQRFKQTGTSQLPQETTSRHARQMLQAKMVQPLSPPETTSPSRQDERHPRITTAFGTKRAVFSQPRPQPFALTRSQILRVQRISRGRMSTSRQNVTQPLRQRILLRTAM